MDVPNIAEHVIDDVPICCQPTHKSVALLTELSRDLNQRVWLTTFEHHLMEKEVPDTDWSIHLRSWLDSMIYRIMDMYLLEQEQQDYPMLKGWLIWRFDDNADFVGDEFGLLNDDLYFQVRMFERCQRQEECVADFFDTIDNISLLAFPSIDPIDRDRIASNQFIDGLSIVSGLKSLDYADRPEKPSDALEMALVDQRNSIDAKLVSGFVAQFCKRCRPDDESYNDYFMSLRSIAANGFPLEGRIQRWSRVKERLYAHCCC